MNLKVDLQNCFGIKSMKHEFVFDSTSSNMHLIYAPNGVMKTSFAKTFESIEKKVDPRELIFDEKSFYKITADGEDIRPEEIFVIKSYEASFKPSSSSSLFVNSKMKEEYEVIISEINKKKKILIDNLNSKSKVKKSEIEFLIQKDFAPVLQANKNSIWDILTMVRADGFHCNESYSEIEYNSIFNDKVIEFIQNPEVLGNIKDFSEQYSNLIQESFFYKPESFSPSNAAALKKSIKKERYFLANHYLVLENGEVVKSDSDLESIIEKANEKIKEDPRLNLILNKILAGTNDVKDFADILRRNPLLVPLLSQLPSLKIEIWKSYFASIRKEVEDLLSEYEVNKNKLENIEEQSRHEKTEWDKARKDFIDRFDVPFDVAVGNYVNSVLGVENPNFLFNIENSSNQSKSFSIDGMISTDFLSQGERRALYLMNVIFELLSLEKDKGRKFVIVDDIADSFDYKNKYAIIEYLRDFYQKSNIYFIIMTHNFDFFRTFQSRIFSEKCVRSYSSYAVKNEGNIWLEKAGENLFRDPFKKWKEKRYENDSFFIAMIPFVRNLMEFSGKNNDNYDLLTDLLHKKCRSEDILVSHVAHIFDNFFRDFIPNSIDNEKKVYSIIFKQADSIVQSSHLSEVKLEDKVVLSIASRLLAEILIFSKISVDEEFENNQTSRLVNLFKERYSGEDAEFLKRLLNRVLISTSENIHINSFMYEPLVDISISNLVRLYEELKKNIN